MVFWRKNSLTIYIMTIAYMVMLSAIPQGLQIYIYACMYIFIYRPYSRFFFPLDEKRFSVQESSVAVYIKKKIQFSCFILKWGLKTKICWIGCWNTATIFLALSAKEYIDVSLFPCRFSMYFLWIGPKSAVFIRLFSYWTT